MRPTGCDTKIGGKRLYNESEYKADKDNPQQLITVHVQPLNFNLTPNKITILLKNDAYLLLPLV